METTTSFTGNLGKVLRQNVREYGMYIALIVIMLIFTVATNGGFLSPGNIANLINQMGYIAVIAVGMTLVIIIRHIDLSVGYLSGFLGAIAAIVMVTGVFGWHMPWYLAILLVLVLGCVVGVLNGWLVATIGIPAFVATLAGWLAFRGAEQWVLASTGTIIIPDTTFNAISNGFIPDIFPSALPWGFHKLTVILGALAIAIFIISALNSRRTKRAYNFEVLPTDMFILQIGLIAVIVGAITYVMAIGQGLPWTAVVVLVVVLVYNFICNQTVLGRHIYAVGGNPEAAALSGINVSRITYLVFISMGFLSALGGVMYAARFSSAAPTAGQLLELDAIAAAYVGGVSAAGGVGKVMGSIVGALVMASLQNGLPLMGVDQSLQYIIRALVLALAVIFDVVTRRRAQ